MDGKGKKRSQQKEEIDSAKKKRDEVEANDEDLDKEEVEFEDPYGDEFDSEDEEIAEEEANEGDDDNEEMDVEEDEEANEGDDDNEEMDVEEDEAAMEKKYGSDWRAVVRKSDLEPGQTMEYDSSAYIMFHSMTVEWPCLSFDVIPDRNGAQRTRFPLSAYFVAGTQAETEADNKLLLLKMSQLHKTKQDDQSDEEDDSDEEGDDDPELEMRSINHPGAVNRVRCMPQEPHVVATWSDRGSVYLWDINKHVKALDAPPSQKLKTPAPILKHAHHAVEGYALDWSPLKKGRLISGDCSNKIYLTDAVDENASAFQSNSQAFTGHKDSVEDLQWSPVEESVFASCSVDKTVKIWDIREKKHTAAKSWKAGDSDINVISWGRKVVYLLVSGCDDGSFRIWDLRSLKGSNNDCMSVAHFKWHTAPITSVSWDPNDESVIAVASEDDQLTLWDLSTERDEEESQQTELADIPPQLLFIHQNQSDIKEVRFHPQLPGVITSTALEGFDIFKPNVTEEVGDK
eukprot:TRINITY_DN1261_c0_g1_i1.p1 TRINITY_DN1261_c0_g1~~TRINITY_DN1261_c0_g1_i1.p1  ORF type:complete len:515 (+),score=163.41 TRINITY_DN1261_c0_g1_i1:163-1707(+)